MSVLEDPKNRVRLLRAGYSGKDIEWLYIHVFRIDIELLDVNWLQDDD